MASLMKFNWDTGKLDFVVDPANPGISHSALDDLVAPADDHTQYLLLAGRAGGQQAFGGTASLEELALRGTQNANIGFIRMQSPVIFDAYTYNPNASYAFNYDATEPTKTVGFVGGGLNMSGAITFTNATFIYESFRGSPVITTGVNPGFAAYTVLQALPNLKAGSGAGHNPLAPLILNAGATVQNDFSGTRTVNAVTGMNFACSLKTTVNGAILNNSRWVGVAVAPLWNCVSGSTVSLGTIIGIDVLAPAQQLFGSSAGTRRMSAFYGMQVANPTINNGFGTAPCAAVRSVISSGTNRFFLLNAGTAHSLFGNSHIYFNDNYGVALGGAGITNYDALVTWNTTHSAYRIHFPLNNSALLVSNPSSERILFNTSIGPASGNGEFNFNCLKFSLGAQVTAIGNQVGAFVTPTRATSFAGDWFDFLLSHSGNITLNHAMGQVYGWSVSAPSITIGTGSVTDAGVLLIDGNVSQGTNRYGLRILSNPSGGTLNYSLRVAGISRLDGGAHIGPNGEVSLIYTGGNLVLTTDLVAASDFLIDCGTEKTIELVETVWDDIHISGAILVGPPGQQPDIEEILDENGAGTGIYTYGVGVGEAGTGSLEILHWYKEGTDVEPHLHFSINAAPTGTDYVKFELTYTVTRPTETVDPSTTISAEIAVDTQYMEYVISFPTIDGSGFGIGDQFQMTLERVVAAGDAFAGDVLTKTFGLHCEKDTMGSRQEFIK